jgi:5-methyltetrahydrofolate--homocysteine methyltransferase
MSFRKFLQENIVIFDGAMGTMMQRMGLQAGELPELLNMSHPDMIRDIHRQYVEAGSHVVSSNTFQASEYKLKDCGYTVEEIISRAVTLAKESGALFTALDVGPVGQLLEPLGPMTFDQAYEMFRRQMVAGEKAGADLILVETMSDVHEVKAALLAAREHTSLPVILSLTYQADGRTFTGTDPVTATLALQGMEPDAIGLNCSMGPRELLPVAEKILRYSKLPVIVQANAGLPEIIDEETVYTITPEEYGESVSAMLDRGVRIIGGCCGTDPEFIWHIAQIVKGRKPIPPKPEKCSAVTSATRTVFLDNRITVIGERINPTGKPKLKEALRENRIEYILNEAIDQAKHGADVLDINVGLPELDEPAVIRQTVKSVQEICTLPLQIDSADPKAIESGLRACNGRAMVNSVNGKRESMDAIFPLVKKYGALVVGLTLDEEGIPETAEGRFAIAEKIVTTGEAYGIPREDILIDCLTLTASAQQQAVLATLEGIRLVKERLGVKTVLGVSNVSFGLPNRPLLNSIFLTAAMGAGLDAPILNPMSEDMMRAVDTFRVFNCQDPGAARYIEKYSDVQIEAKTSAKKPPTQLSADDKAAAGSPETDAFESLMELIIDGLKEETADQVRLLLKTHPPLEIIDQGFVPALNQVGDGFETGEIFLPSLMMSAEAVKAGFDVIKENRDPAEEASFKGKVVVATVQGDIHDIGKNIAKMLLENYGYEVIDLGRDVPIQKVVEAVREHQAKLVGLSALMTTTVKNMKSTIAAIREAGLDCGIMVGGAVLNPEYAQFVGADYFVKDAREGVEIAKKVF